MDEAFKIKYEGYKLTVTRWEKEFKITNKRIPSKFDIKDAPTDVRQAYKMYYRMKTTFLAETLTDTLEDDDDNFPTDQIVNSEPPTTNQLTTQNLQEFEAAEEYEYNVSAWNDKITKAKAPPKPKEPTKLQRKISMKLEPLTIKPLRNPKKSLSHLKSSSSSLSLQDSGLARDNLPDLETILLEKSRASSVTQKTSVLATASDLSADIDIGWLDRNTSSNNLSTTRSTLSTASSFGLSNLNMNSFVTATTAKTCPVLNAEVKFHTLDTSDLEIVGNSDDEVEAMRPPLHVAKKRRLSEEPNRPSIDAEPIVKSDKLTTELPTIDEEPKKNEAEDHKEFTEEEKTPPPMKRKRSLIKRSKDGIAKVTRKATKILTRGKKKEEENFIPPQPEEEEINFLIDSDVNTITTVPRASQKELQSTEKLFDDYVNSIGTTSVNKEPKVIDAKTAAKKEALQKRIASGTLNENFVRVNLKKKVFVRGKKAFSFSKYKKSVWKSKKAAALSGPEMDMGGCDGGVLKCFNCGGVGHFAQKCKQKGDNLLPLDVEVIDESPFPSLSEAAQMAQHQRLVVHCNKLDMAPERSNDLWKDIAETTDEEAEQEIEDKENKDDNREFVEAPPDPPKVAYIGHKIPDDFLAKSGLLEMNVGNKDEVHSVYKKNFDGSLPPTPKEVFDALKMFGHGSFRFGQEQAIMRVMCGMSTLVTLSTGSGKSLCYQLPAYLYKKKSHCITLVVSPLVSLMEDQVLGIPDFVNACCLHTNQTPKQREKTMEAVKTGQVDILIVSPEAVVAGEKSTGFGSLLRQLPPIAFACIDEAHCVSQWSHNFRPSYLMICRVLREKLGVKTVLGLTATATLQTRESIVRHLGLTDGLSGIISDTPLPDNLILTISQDEHRDNALIALLHSERFQALQSIIIYCTRREQCDTIAGNIRTRLMNQSNDARTASNKRKKVNWHAEAYHAGLPASRRRVIQSAFMAGELRIVVATIAFGMGINKSDIRGIIHYNMPKSFESYVQEVGRAGRDGKPAHCHVFLESKGGDLSELRRHIYSNSVDRHVIRKLLKRVFVPCACGNHSKTISKPTTDPELQNINFEDSDDEMTGIQEKSLEEIKPRSCPGHEVSFSIDETVQSLDIPEENIATLLCYLELHEQRYIKVLGNAYTKCKIISYGGPKHLKQAAKTCPPLAMAIALDLKKKEAATQELTSIEFCVVDVAAAIGWDSGVVKYQLKQLEWTTVNGANKRSSITVSFSDLGFRIRSPGDLTDEELDTALDSLEVRTSSQEKTQLTQLQIIFNSFKSLSFARCSECSSSDLPVDRSNSLKTIIRSYFQSDLPMNVVIDESSDTLDGEIISDIRQMISMYPENNFSGRALARVFHGISSPCYPAVIWGRCKYWRAHMNVNFGRLVNLGNSELVKMRRVA